MIKFELKHEEFDAICLALFDAQKTVKGPTAKVYETLRRKLRTVEPNSFSMKKLMKENK